MVTTQMKMLKSSFYEDSCVKKLRAILKSFFVIKRTRVYYSHLNMESLILLAYFFHGPLREKIVANEKEFIVITSPTKSKSSISTFLSYSDLCNNDINIIQYYDQCKNSYNNIYHLNLSNNDNLKADNILHWISNLSPLEYLDLSGINLQKETN
ncbi:hypothetical protein Ahy_A09g046000 isoform A [Arachis hypogaea]|uniref:Uncharacterized protein n=1 Tax=Arachis hypogaea TaxID=3818 RepID=A0A445BNL0_ARAHY|nr:hypothetical protein Ahy_A09g046000 isoform A [Arachis hypogaea]